MIRRILLLSIPLFTPLPVMAGQVVARVETGRYTLSIISNGAPNADKCGLSLVAEAYKF